MNSTRHVRCGLSLPWAFLLLAAGCSTDDHGRSSAAELQGGDQVGLDDAGAPDMEPLQVAWEGGSRPGGEVWKPDPTGPATPAFDDSFLARLRGRKGDSMLLIQGRVGALATELWEEPAPSSPWLGPNVVTKVELTVTDMLCGQAPSEVAAYFQGGTAGLRTDQIEYQPHPDIGDAYGLLLDAREGRYFIVTGELDLLRPQPDGTFVAFDGARLIRSELVGACP